MPNWCDNAVTMYHPDPAMVDRAEQAIANNSLLNEFIPVPKDLLVEGVATYGGDDADARDALRKANKAKWGYESWYDYCNAKWGTKWDISDADAEREDQNTLRLSFQSAWSPPVEAYHTLTMLGFVIDAYYYECGMAFCGHYTSEGGDDYYDIQGGSDWVEENIPEDINEAFSIAENLEMWEEEVEEDEGVDS